MNLIQFKKKKTIETKALLFRAKKLYRNKTKKKVKESSSWRQGETSFLINNIA